MESLLWILGFIPKWAWFVCFTLSFLTLAFSKFLKRFQFFVLHSWAIYVSSLVLLLVSTWFLGFQTNEEKWKKEIQKTKAAIEVLENKNLELSKDLEKASQEKEVVIKEKTKRVVQYLEKEVFRDKEVVKYIETCPQLPPKVIELHNKAVELK